MTTATANRAPTADELRSLLRQVADGDRSGDIDIGAWVYRVTQPIHYAEPGEGGDEPGVLWTCMYRNLTMAECKRLSGLLEGVYREADAIQEEAIARIIELAVSAGLTFAEEYPDAPRA